MCSSLRDPRARVPWVSTLPCPPAPPSPGDSALEGDRGRACLSGVPLALPCSLPLCSAPPCVPRVSAASGAPRACARWRHVEVQLQAGTGTATAVPAVPSAPLLSAESSWLEHSSQKTAQEEAAGEGGGAREVPRVGAKKACVVWGYRRSAGN